jgi:hypothetical protein
MKLGELATCSITLPCHIGFTNHASLLVRLEDISAPIPPSMVVDGTWELKYNFDDLTASLADPQGYTKPVLRDFFKASQVPHFQALDLMECKSLAESLYKAWKAQQEGTRDNPHCLQALKKKQLDLNRAMRAAAPKQKVSVRLRAKVRK